MLATIIVSIMFLCLPAMLCCVRATDHDVALFWMVVRAAWGQEVWGWGGEEEGGALFFCLSP